jgi:hypothetical protein
MKVILVGGPRSGKSTYAGELRKTGIPTYCADPYHMVKEPEFGVIYLPDWLIRWSEQSQYIADTWFKMPRDSWCIEGVATVRALRKYLLQGGSLEGIKVIKFDGSIPGIELKPGQKSMAKGVDKIWAEISDQIPNFSVRHAPPGASK